VRRSDVTVKSSALPALVYCSSMVRGSFKVASP
jgi:hypothetical protein